MIRHADPERDAAACAELYAPFVDGTVISLEDEPPGASEFAERIASTTERYPWLVLEDDEGWWASLMARSTARGPPTAGRWT